MLLGIISFSIWRVRLSNDVARRLEALRAAGFPTSGAEWNAYYPSVPESENAALVITQAFAQMASYPDARSNLVASFKLPPGTQPLTPEQKELLAGQVELNRAAIQTARQGLLRPKSRYPIDLSPGFAALLPHLSYLKKLAQTISYEGVLAAGSNQPEEAIQSIGTVLQLSKTLENEPLLISALVRMSMDKMAELTLEHCLNAGQLNKENLAALDQALQGWEGTNKLFQAMIGERAAAIPLFQMNFAQFSSFIKAEDTDIRNVHGGPGAISVTLLMRASGLFDRDLRYYLMLMETNINLSKISPPDNLVITNVWNDAMLEMKSRYLFMSAMLLPGLNIAYLRNAEAVANVRVSRVAVAIKKFRLLQNRLPLDLDELNGLISVELRIDPFNGQSLRYKQLKKGYIVYSVGRDGEDNGGHERPADAKSSDKTPYDITFTVMR